MSLSNAFGFMQGSDDGLRSFHSQADIRALLEKNDAHEEDFMRSEMLMIFETRTQHTWLVATIKALHCVFDSRREPDPRRIWRIAREDIVEGGEIRLVINEVPLTDRDSYVVIDERRPRKFTRELFQTLSIRDSIQSMLRSAFRLS